MLLSIKSQNRQFINCLRALPALLALMMICRGILFWLSSGDTDPAYSWKVVLSILWMGLRFDVLVLGFIYMPLAFLTWLPTQKIQSIYLGFSWFAITALNFLNLGYFLKYNSHRYWTDHQAGNYGSDLLAWVKAENNITTSLVILVYIFILIIGWKKISESVYFSDGREVPDREKSLDEMSPRERFEQPLRQVLRVLGPFLLTMAMARGTFTQHHLRREHAMITPSSLYNEIILNPQWTFDKVRP